MKTQKGSKHCVRNAFTVRSPFIKLPSMVFTIHKISKGLGILCSNYIVMLENANNKKNSGEANATIFDRVTENIPRETLGKHSGFIQETCRRGESHDPRQGSLKMNIGRHAVDIQKTSWRARSHDPR